MLAFEPRAPIAAEWSWRLEKAIKELEGALDPAWLEAPPGRYERAWTAIRALLAPSQCETCHQWFPELEREGICLACWERK